MRQIIGRWRGTTRRPVENNAGHFSFVQSLFRKMFLHYYASFRHKKPPKKEGKY